MREMKIIWSYVEPEKHNIWMRPFLDKEGVDFLYFDFDRGKWMKVALVIPQEEDKPCGCKSETDDCCCKTKKE